MEEQFNSVLATCMLKTEGQVNPSKMNLKQISNIQSEIQKPNPYQQRLEVLRPTSRIGIKKTTINNPKVMKESIANLKCDGGNGKVQIKYWTRKRYMLIQFVNDTKE